MENSGKPTSDGPNDHDLPSATGACGDSAGDTRQTAATLDPTVAILEFLTERDSFDYSELVQLCPGLSDVQLALAFHQAREQLRADPGVEFISRVRDQPGHYFRADARQMLNRVARFVQTGNRKLRRAIVISDAAVAREDVTQEEAEKAQRLRERAANQIAMRRAAEHARIEVPTSTPDPPAFPGRTGRKVQ